jgi:hypothetical protein
MSYCVYCLDYYSTSSQDKLSSYSCSRCYTLLYFHCKQHKTEKEINNQVKLQDEEDDEENLRIAATGFF